jgi:ABC-type multidrug transport system ATPase subunit
VPVEQPLVAELTGVSRRFGARVVLDGFDLRIAAGERVGVAGPNGAGKTTLLRCLAGTLGLSAGEIRVAGNPVGSLAARRATGVSLAHERSFYERLSARENLRIFARLRARPKAAERAVDGVLDELELAPLGPSAAGELSAGQQAQFGLARALLGDPVLILLDETTRSLDDDARERLWSALERRPHAGAMIASHRHEDLDRCTRVIRLRATA